MTITFSPMVLIGYLCDTDFVTSLDMARGLWLDLIDSKVQMTPWHACTLLTYKGHQRIFYRTVTKNRIHATFIK